MSDEEIEELIKPAISICKTLQYDEDVVIGSVLGELRKEIKSIRDK